MLFWPTAPSTPSENSVISFQMYKKSGWFGGIASKSVTIQYLPTQFISKLYTEGFGRAPDTAGFKYWMDYFKANGCTKNNLQALANGIYTCSEYNNLNYTPEQEILTIYRGILNRDPDQAGFDFYRANYSKSALLFDILNGTEFNILIASIFNGKYYLSPPGSILNMPYQNVTNDPFCTAFTGTTEDELQSLLNQPNVTVVGLQQNQIVSITKPLIIPAGKTLTTVGGTSLTNTQYAKYGRLARSTTFSGATLQLNGNNSILTKVWLDGRAFAIMQAPDASDNHVINTGFSDCSIISCKFSSCNGATNVRGDHGAANMTISYNIITQYDRPHLNAVAGPHNDGLTIAAYNSTITNNSFVDINDVAIALIANGLHIAQKATVDRNVVFNAVARIHSAIGTDPGTNWQDIPDFSQCIISNNIVFGGSRAHMIFGIFVGARPWFGTNANQHNGVRIESNVIGLASYPLNCNMGIIVNNCKDASIKTNKFNLNLTNAITNLPEYYWFNNIPLHQIGVCNDAYTNPDHILDSYSLVSNFIAFDGTIEMHK